MIKVHDFVLAHRRLNIRKTAETVCILKDCMGFRLVEILCVFGISQRPRNSSNIGLHPVNLLRRCVLHRLVGEIQIHLSTILLKK